MKVIQTYDRIVSTIVKYVNALGISVLFLLIFVTTADVVGRYLRHPIPGAFELVEMGLATAVFFGVAYTTLQRGHISIEWFVERLSPKKRLVIDAINSLLMAICWAFVGWQGYRYAMRTRMVISDVLEINLTFNKMMVPLGAFLVILILVSQFLGYIRQLRNLPKNEREESI